MAKTYQPIRVKGHINDGVYERSCDERYDLLRPYFDRYQRRFTVFDLGANLGYFEMRMAEDGYDAVKIMAEPDKRLLDVCKSNEPVERTVVLNTYIDSTKLQAIADSEHFDVVLALSVLHHFAADWRAVTDAVLDLGTEVLVELPHPDDGVAAGQPIFRDILNYIEGRGATLVASALCHTSTQKRPIYYLKRNKETLKTAYIGRPGNAHETNVAIHSTYQHKSITIRGQERDFFHGINLQTYRLMGGAYPVPQQVYKAIMSTPPPAGHADIRPWNLMLDGSRAQWIDEGFAGKLDEKTRQSDWEHTALSAMGQGRFA